MFGGKRKALEEEVERLQSRLTSLSRENQELTKTLRNLEGLEAVEIERFIKKRNIELLKTKIEVAEAHKALVSAKQRIIETDDTAILQEAGIYRYRHPLEDAIAYRGRLKTVNDAIKALIKDGAVSAATDWTVGGSKSQGRKLVRDLSKLMLRAYNTEVDNIIRTLKPYTLDTAIARLDRARETITKLGSIIELEITQKFHRLRMTEIELTADYLAAKEEEKERQREERARQREEQKVQREIEEARKRLEKERAHYQAALAKLRASGDVQGLEDLEGKLAEIDSAITGLDYREANIRAGYVYVISNFGSFGDHIVKIGMTRRLDPMDRVRELGDASVPFNFDVHAMIFSQDAVGLEQQLHQTFSDRRVNLVNMRREYFFVSPGQVRDALEQIGGQQLLEFHEVPEAEEWRISRARKHDPVTPVAVDEPGGNRS